MTISHRRHRGSSSTSSTPLGEEMVARSDMSGSTNDEEEAPPAKSYLRGSSELPPPIVNESERPLIRPDGETHWIELPKLRKDVRKPNGVLTILLKTHHPGVVIHKGKSVFASTWAHYNLRPSDGGRSKAEDVEEEFWLRFRHEPEYRETAKLHLEKCCNQLLVSVLYYARIQAILDHAYKTENRKIKDKLAGQRYLEKDEYMAQRPWWCTDFSWEVLVDEWCSSKWIEQSKKNRGNRLTSKYKVHRGGSNSLTTICQKLSEKEGREVSKIEAWMHTHRGADPNNPDVLNSVAASKCLDLYKEKVGNMHGKDYDWLRSPIVPQALYEAGNGKPHGKWSLFNGAVEGRETLREVQINRSSSSSKRQQVEHDRRIVEQHELMKRHAHNMTEWGKSVQTTVQNSLGGLHKFLMTIADIQGIPGPEIPHIAIPPPPAFPTSITSSPIFSPEMRSSGESANGAENDNTLHVTGEGMFGGFFDTNGNDANGFPVGNFSPPGDDLPAF